MQFKRITTNGVVFLVSVTISLVICEAGLRLFLNPADYLSVETVKDDLLGITIAPDSVGFDEWGFRNRDVPPTVDIVTIGDSHTYGNNARMDGSWPHVVARVSGMSVYNMALGGYGPNQYHYLLRTRALKLDPSLILCGLYFGDDFENAFSITYGLDYWSFLRRAQWDKVDPHIWEVSEQVSWHKRVRNWLSRNSIMYRLVVHGPVLGKVKAYLQFRQVSRSDDTGTTSLITEEDNIREAFRPIDIAKRLDQSSGPVREGMRITFQLLKEMNDACLQNDCRFLVVVIPTKEMVFSDYLEKDSTIHLHGTIHNLITNEHLARNEMFEFLENAGILYVDTLQALKKATGDGLYGRSTTDMHPSEHGYRVVGEAVAEFLDQIKSVRTW